MEELTGAFPVEGIGSEQGAMVPFQLAGKLEISLGRARGNSGSVRRGVNA